MCYGNIHRPYSLGIALCSCHSDILSQNLNTLFWKTEIPHRFFKNRQLELLLTSLSISPDVQFLFPFV
jgi:hypothetical protein